MHRLAAFRPTAPQCFLRGTALPTITAGTGMSTYRNYASSTKTKAKDGAKAGPTKGRTGGGEPLSSSENPPPRPKIFNSSVSFDGNAKLTKEQQEEVDRHNAEFEKKPDRASAAAKDKVDKEFWTKRSG